MEKKIDIPKHGCFFKDGERRADYVIVIKGELLSPLVTYIRALEFLGLELELVLGQTVERIFLLIHIPQSVLKHFAKFYNVDHEEKNFNLPKRKKLKHLSLYSTPISDIAAEEKGWLSELLSTDFCWQFEMFIFTETYRHLYRGDTGTGATVYFIVKKPGSIKDDTYDDLDQSILRGLTNSTYTSADRIIIVNNLLEYAKYGDKLNEKGITKLIKIKWIEAAYPLHDGPEEIGNYNIVYANDRQLLFFYWSNFRVWYKELPLDMIHKYFGSEIAFYFAWLEFFNLMLLPAAILGFLVFVVNLIIVMVFPIYRIKETCNVNNMWICPTCELQKHCAYNQLSSYCTYVKWCYVFDNYLTIAFAVFMSLWATIFINLWRRKQNKLQLRWDVVHAEMEGSARQEYLDNVSKKRFNKMNMKLEPILRTVFTVSVCIFMIILVLAVVFGVIMFKITITTAMKAGDAGYFKEHAKMISMMAASVLQVIFIKLFGKMYGKLSIWLTNFENPRTQLDYDNSVLYKRYLLSFANNYAALFYLAFLKGRLFSLPHRIKSFTSLVRDTCQPSTCIGALCLQLAFLMLFKKFAGNILTFLFPKCKKYIKHFTIFKEKHLEELPQYEKEYTLLPTNRYLLTTEFCEMVIEYGFVTFFVAAFPLAPLFALLNNILETRLDAYKLVKRYRRPVPRRVSGIGSWDGIMTGLTYLSTATNAFVIAFTSDFIGRELYRTKNNYSLKGYINSTLSEFATKDYVLYKHIPPNPDTCYYKAMRHPPHHLEKYQLTSDFWGDIAWRLICVFIFEHIIFTVNAILSYAIPDIPHSVKQQLDIDRRLAKEAKLKLLNDEMKQGKNKGTGINKFDTDPFVYTHEDSDEPGYTFVATGPIGGFLYRPDE